MEQSLKDKLHEKLRMTPGDPGVYLYKDAKDKFIYIGKAKNLRHRVRSYFQASRDYDPKTEKLVREIADVEFIVTRNEYEAFLLESNLIHQHRPRYNIFLKDDKSFPFIKVTVKENFPRIGFTRRPVKDGSRYFGPFIPASRARHLIDVMRKFFGIRHCRKDIDGSAATPCCLDYHIHRCLAPCVASICGAEQYRQAVSQAVLFLDGKTRELTHNLEQEMKAAAAEQRFEDAALVRDRLSAVGSLAETQHVYMAGREDDADIFGYFRQDCRLAVQVFHMRGSKIVDRRQFFWEELETWKPGRFFRDFLQQFYVHQPAMPTRVLVPVTVAEFDLLEKWLSEKQGRRVTLVRPQRGERVRLMDLATRNAKLAFYSRFAGAQQEEDVLKRLQHVLGLPKIPHVIEAFDISNIQGDEVVASMVTAVGGKMTRNRYRRFKIRTVAGRPDDFASMREVVFRRYSRVLKETKDLPDLIVVDGGAGQVSSATDSLRKLELADKIPLCGLAKENEEIFLCNRKNPIRLDRTAPELKLLQKIRDEAHRFAVTYHRQRRRAASMASRLDDVPGVGPRRKKILLQTFCSWEKILGADSHELETVLGKKTGEKIYQYLKGRKFNAL